MGNTEIYLSLYKTMKKIRFVEDRIADEYPKREMHTPIHLYTGEEAIAAGVCENLVKQDCVISNHRCHGHYLAKGGNLSRMIAELYNKETGCTKGRGGSMHLMDKEVNFSLTSSIVAGGVPIGTGNALASYLRNQKNVTVIFLGDAATEEGCVFESICFAKLLNLPVIFVCENNLYSICTPLGLREPVKNPGDKFKTILPVIEVDGNNVLNVYESSKNAIENARNGKGPAFIECKTYRLKDHHNIGTGVELGYRSQEEWDKWHAKSPIDSFEEVLKDANLLNKEIKDSVELLLNKEIDEAFQFAKESCLPKKEDLQLHVYSEVR